MILKLLRSRGSRKFRKNRLAMASLVIIAAYVGLSVWIAGVNLINWAGARSDAFTLEGTPITGLFLTSSTRQPVGPQEMPGFGLMPAPERQLGAADEYLEIARQGLAAVRRLDPDSDRTDRDALYDVAWRDRPFAMTDIGELERLLAEAERPFEQIVDLRRRLQSLRSLPVAVRDIESARAELAALLESESPDEDGLLIAQEELAFSIQDFADAIESYTRAAGEDSPISRLGSGPLFDLGEEIEFADSAGEIDLGSLGLLDGYLEAAGEAERPILDKIRATLPELWDAIGVIFPEPTGLRGLEYGFKLLAGTDKQGRSILIRAMYSSYVAMQVGLVTALFAVGFGGVFGAAAAFFGGPTDHVFNWLYSMITSIPYLVLLAVLSFLFLGSPVESTLIPLYVAFGVTYWVGPGRVVRGEALKIRELEYVQATTALGFGRGRILLRHVLPNTVHLLFINFSLLFIAAIKGEVILTFLGLGLKDGASWGIMIQQGASQVVNDFFWQIGAATFFMFLLVLAFNIFTDALQDAFDPKHVS